MSNRDLLPGIGAHLPNEIVHEVLLYTWRYQHALQLKQVHDDIKDGTNCVLQMIKTPEAYRNGRGLNKTDTFGG